MEIEETGKLVAYVAGACPQQKMNALTPDAWHDILGHLGASQEITVPFTVEFDRHFAWKGAFRPYVGLGGGYYFHKYYRTATANTGAPGAGVFLSFGGNLPVDDRHLIGIDARVSHVNGRDGIVNPVFGAEKASMNFWSIKVNWAYAY